MNSTIRLLRLLIQVAKFFISKAEEEIKLCESDTKKTRRVAQ